MNSRGLSDFFETYGKLFTEKRFAELARLHRQPCVVFPVLETKKPYYSLDSTQILVAELRSFHRKLSGHRDHVLTPLIIRIEQNKGRYQVDVKWLRSDCDGSEKEVSQTRYFLSGDSEEDLAIEMIEHLTEGPPASRRAH